MSSANWTRCRGASPLALLGPALVGAALLGCSKSQCANEVVSGRPSPDGTVIAFVYYRSCGAKTGSSTNVSLVDFRSALRNGPGNVLAVSSEQPVKVSWLGPKKLLVTGFKSPVDRRNQQIGAVSIEFR